MRNSRERERKWNHQGEKCSKHWRKLYTSEPQWMRTGAECMWCTLMLARLVFFLVGVVLLVMDMLLNTCLTQRRKVTHTHAAYSAEERRGWFVTISHIRGGSQPCRYDWHGSFQLGKSGPVFKFGWDANIFLMIPKKTGEKKINYNLPIIEIDLFAFGWFFFGLIWRNIAWWIPEYSGIKPIKVLNK